MVINDSNVIVIVILIAVIVVRWYWYSHRTRPSRQPCSPISQGKTWQASEGEGEGVGRTRKITSGRSGGRKLQEGAATREEAGGAVAKPKRKRLVNLQACITSFTQVGREGVGREGVGGRGWGGGGYSCQSWALQCPRIWLVDRSLD